MKLSKASSSQLWTKVGGEGTEKSEVKALSQECASHGN